MISLTVVAAVSVLTVALFDAIRYNNAIAALNEGRYEALPIHRALWRQAPMTADGSLVQRGY